MKGSCLTVDSGCGLDILRDSFEGREGEGLYKRTRNPPGLIYEQTPTIIDKQCGFGGCSMLHANER